MDMRWLSHRRAALLKLNRFAEAQKAGATLAWLEQLNQLSQQASRNARNPAAWIVRGKHLMNGSQYGAAIQDFTRALIVSPGNPDALTGRASAWMATGDLQKAMLDCDESIVVRSSQEAHSLRGDLWMLLENVDNAISDFETAGRFDEQVAVAYEKRANDRQEAGQELTMRNPICSVLRKFGMPCLIRKTVQSHRRRRTALIPGVDSEVRIEHSSSSTPPAEEIVQL